MIRFDSDYTEGCSQSVLKALTETNYEQTDVYGMDEYCEMAKAYIRNLCGNKSADVHFLMGGTQTNMTVIASALRPYQGVICAETGHINVHETGAVEGTGHKIITIPSFDGKITAEAIEKTAVNQRNDENAEHTVQPKLVYISFPTENGALYSDKELSDISRVCKEQDLYLFADGARLGYGLMSPYNDVTLKRLSELTDVFYLGGTKQGLLFGEAVVITNDRLKTDFRYMIKHMGGMLAKGRLLGVQFLSSLESGEYFNLSEKADEQALKIRKALEDEGIEMYYDSYTNQQFPVFENDLLRRLEKKYVFSHWCSPDPEHTVVRVCTSWATKDKIINDFLKDVKLY